MYMLQGGSAWTQMVIVIHVFSPGEITFRTIRQLCAVQLTSGHVY